MGKALLRTLTNLRLNEAVDESQDIC